MRFALIPLVAAAPLTLIAVPGHAQQRHDAVARTQIVAGDYDFAERKLVADLRVRPDSPELLLNLAAVYAMTDRANEARSLYQRVLQQDDVLMDLSGERTASSHAIAQRGLSRLVPVQLTTR